METELKTRWVEALRSGKYPQASGLLRCEMVEQDGTHQDGFCCLGVLKDLVEPDGWESEDDDGFKVWRHGDLGDRDFPSTSFLERVGLDYGHAQALAGHNDDGVAFSEIAQMIESDEYESTLPVADEDELVL